MQRNRTLKAAIIALSACFAAAAPAAAMSFDPDSIKTADDCISAAIALEAYDIANNGGGVLELDEMELETLVETCEANTNTKTETFRGMINFKLDIKPM